MTRVADASVLYAFFHLDDAHHDRARAALADPEPIHVPAEIVGELVDLIDYRVDWTVAKGALQRLLEMPHVHVMERIKVGAVQRIYEAGDGRVSFHDALLVHACHVLGATALSYDDDLLAVARAHGIEAAS